MYTYIYEYIHIYMLRSVPYQIRECAIYAVVFVLGTLSSIIRYLPGHTELDTATYGHSYICHDLSHMTFSKQLFTYVYVYVHVYICIYIYTCTCLSFALYLSLSLSLYLFLSLSLSLYIYIHIYIFMYRARDPIT